MRYVVLLLIFCVSFGVLDSVPHPGTHTGGPTIGAPYSTHDFSTLLTTPVMIAPEPGLIVRAHHKYMTRVHPTKVAAAVTDVAPVVAAFSPPVAADSVSGRTAADSAAAAFGTPAPAPVVPDSAMGAATMVARTPGAPGEVASPPVPPALAESRLTLASLDAAPAPMLREFAAEAVDRTGTPFFRDTIRNLLMDPDGVRFGGMAGLNWSGAAARENSGKIGGRSLTGLTLGVFADVPLKKHLSIRPKTQYAYKGYQPVVNGMPITIHVAYLHTAADIIYHTGWLQRRLFVGLGPYAAYGVTGTYTLKGINNDMAFGNQAGDNLRRMDYGLDGTAGLLMDRNFVLSAEFNLGLRNIALGQTEVHTGSVALMVTYVFRNRSLF